MQPDEAIAVMDAIRMQTIWAAFAGFQEKDKGSIEVGKLADLVVVSENPVEDRAPIVWARFRPTSPWLTARLRINARALAPSP